MSLIECSWSALILDSSVYVIVYLFVCLFVCLFGCVCWLFDGFVSLLCRLVVFFVCVCVCV